MSFIGDEVIDRVLIVYAVNFHHEAHEGHEEKKSKTPFREKNILRSMRWLVEINLICHFEPKGEMTGCGGFCDSNSFTSLCKPPNLFYIIPRSS